MSRAPRRDSDAAGAGISLCVLGPLRLFRGTARVELPPSKKTRALLAYLAVTARPQTREHLCDLLWEGPDDPRGALRWSLAKLRPLLEIAGESCVRTVRDEVAFDVGRGRVDWLDVHAVERGGLARATSEDLERAAATFTGSFLEGLELPGATRFAAWCAGVREHVHAVRRAVWRERQMRSAGDAARELDLAHDWLRTDPLDEAAHVAVVRALAALGRGRDALQHYEVCAAMLEREAGVKPSPELEAARREVGTMPSPPRAAGAPASVPPVQAPRRARDSVPFVGRQDLCAEIAGWIAVPAEEPRVLALTGAPGIGKTRLLREVASAFEARGGRVLRGRAYSAEQRVPFAIWAGALRGSDIAAQLDARTRGWLAPVLPECADARGAAVRDVQLDAALRAALRAAAEPSGVLVGFDDAQWMDDASVALLSSMLRGAGPRVTFVLTAREAELLEHGALRQVMRATRRDGAWTTRRLGPLDAGASLTLVRASGIEGADDAVRLAEASEGNPFVALELARAQRDGTPAERLESLLHERLERLSAPARRLAESLAAVGRRVDPVLLDAVCAPHAVEAQHALEELERAGIVDAGEEELAFTHELLRDAAYAHLSPPRRRIVHGQLAAALVAIGRETRAVEAFRHATMAGREDLVAQCAAPAAEHLLRAFAVRDALETTDRGRAALAALPAAERVPAEIALLAVEVHASAARRRPGLAADLERVATLSARDGAPEVAARAQYLVSVVREQLGDHAGAAASVRAQTARSRDADAATRAFALANSGRCLAMLERDLPVARRELAEAETLAREAGVWPVELPLGWGFVAAFAGDDDEARRRWREALALARAESDHWRASVCLTRLAMQAIEHGDHAIARMCVGELQQVAAALGGGSEVSVAALLACLADARAPEAGGAESRELDEALALVRAAHSHAHLAWILIRLAERARERGDSPGAVAHAREAAALAEGVGRASLAVEALALAAALGDEAARAELPDAAHAAELSARTRRALAAAAASFSTPVHTRVHTPAADAVFRRRRASAARDATDEQDGTTARSSRRRQRHGSENSGGSQDI